MSGSVEVGKSASQSDRSVSLCAGGLLLWITKGLGLKRTSEAKHDDEKVSILILSFIMFSDRVIVVSIVHRPGTRGVTVYTFVLLLIYKFNRR